MLRRKLLIIFGSLVILLVVMAASAIWLLQGVLRDLDHINTQAVGLMDQAGRLMGNISAIELELYKIQTGKQHHLDALIGGVDSMREQVDSIGRHYAMREPGMAGVYAAMRGRLPTFERHVGALATAQDPVLAGKHNAEALTSATELREDIRRIDQGARDHARAEQLALTRRFRWLVLGFAIGGLLVINVLIVFLFRTAVMVLRPMDKLVEASRQLTHQRFDYRAHLDEKDEFLELAQAYNSLAERLQTNEQRKMEMLGQVALTLNHELNNAIATIDLQLEILARKTGGDAKVEASLRQIQENLQRMVQTVESLKRIRRIVLTDYIAGVKMLDLKQSVQDEASPKEAASAPEGRTDA
jgi:HAMP domain-containing protein